MRALDRADHLAVVGQRRRRDGAHVDDRRHRLAPGAASRATLCRHAGLPSSRRAAPTARRASARHRPATLAARHFSASNALTLIATIVACGNSECEPVVKSCSRVPTAITTSASWASALAAVPPVTPIGPACSGWSHGSALFPACVSHTGTSCVARTASAAARRRCRERRRPRSAAGCRAARSSIAAASSSTASGTGARMRAMVGAKNSSG